jgi:hypothetical protein
MIERIYSILDKSEKLKLRNLLITDEEIYPQKKCVITIGDWVQIMRERKEVTENWRDSVRFTRLCNCLSHGTIKYECLNDVQEHHILNLRNAGYNTWTEFDKLRKKYLEDKFEK